MTWLVENVAQVHASLGLVGQFVGQKKQLRVDRTTHRQYACATRDPSSETLVRRASRVRANGKQSRYVCRSSH
eukprot:6209156-Pleurochrysis_carterae.AAC.1